ncbi:hypothetical protein GOBAR_AA14473 [Gossypium barbadense]|uniref:Uncharacterized protein n=1 Tax=Gossypium barbadense TaxID=3634 RepID=A0A2P5XS40_GOSBA|nr:hypothetical protein GOBAR_AA14473 [Gossypium barbadense]
MGGSSISMRNMKVRTWESLETEITLQVGGGDSSSSSSLYLLGETEITLQVGGGDSSSSSSLYLLGGIKIRFKTGLLRLMNSA